MRSTPTCDSNRTPPKCSEVSAPSIGAVCTASDRRTLPRMSGGAPERTREYRNHHLDSTRWDAVNPRDDDIVITTAYKAGTTWTQRIVAGLVFGPGPCDIRA